MTELQEDRHPVETLAEEFISRFRKGENPSITEYALRYPQWADEILEVFPAATFLEELKRPRPCLPREARPGNVPAQFGDFRIVGEIGRGGMGVVYEAVQVSLGRRVALKVLPDQGRLRPQQLERFRREAVAAGKLHHTNIVPVFGIGECDGLHYYVMQYIPGQGLDHVLSWLSVQHREDQPNAAAELAQTVFSPLTPDQKAPPGPDGDVTAVLGRSADGGGTQASAASSRMVWFPSANDPEYYRQVARIGAEVADALAYAHCQGILHRDIKPANLLLDEGGQIWVTDFGLAKLSEQDDLTRPGEMAGTLRYSAPERFQGKADGRSDLFSLALTLYELCTLRPAYDETDQGRLVVQAMNARITRPRAANPSVPRDLETVLLRALEAEPDRRYPSAAEMADDLRRFLDDRPVRARRANPAEHLWRLFRRNKLVAGLTAALIFVCLLGLGLLTWKWREAAANLALSNRSLAQAAREAKEKEEALLSAKHQRQLAESKRVEADRERKRAEERSLEARKQSERAERNLLLALEACEGIADRLAPARPATPLDPALEEGVTVPAGSSDTAPVISPEVAVILQALIGFYQKFTDTNTNNSEFRLAAARAQRRIGTLQLRLDKYDKAEAALRRACELLRSTGNQQLELAQVHNDLGAVLRAVPARLPDAVSEHRQALEMLEEIEPKTLAVRLEQARSHNQIGALQMRLRQPDEAEKSQRTALAILARLPGKDANEAGYRHTKARASYDLSLALMPRFRMDGSWTREKAARRFREAGAAREDAKKLLSGLTADHANVPEYKAELVEVLLGFPPPHPQFRLPPSREAQQQVKQDLVIAVELAGHLTAAYPKVPEYQKLHERAEAQKKAVFAVQEAAARSEERIQKAVKSAGDVGKRIAKSSTFRVLAAEGRLSLAEMLSKRNDLAGAEKVIRHSLNDLQRGEVELPRDRQIRGQLIKHHRRLGEVLEKQGKKKEAEEAFARMTKLGGKR